MFKHIKHKHIKIYSKLQSGIFLGQCQQQWWNVRFFRSRKFMKDLICYENENELFSVSQVHRAQFQVTEMQIFL